MELINRIFNNKNIANKIMNKILFWGSIAVTATFFIMLEVNFNLSIGFHKSQLDKEVKILKTAYMHNNFENLKEGLIELSSNDLYISKIRFNDEILLDNKQEILFGQNYVINNNNVEISYDIIASELYTAPLKKRMAGVLIVFIGLVFLTFYFLSKLFYPLKDISLFAKSFDINKASFLSFDKKNKIIPDEFLNIRDSINSIIKKLNESLQNNKKLANTDSLTNLNNRLKMEEVINSYIYKQKHFSVLFLDLDEFKRINDSLGHQIGDTVLVKSADLLRETVETNNIFRLGGDEFIILLDTINKHEVEQTSNDILNAFRNNVFFPHKYDLFITTSIGISIYSLDGFNSPELLKKSDIALYKSKANDKDGFTFFEDYMEEEVNKTFVLEKEIKHAIENDEFILHLQPQVNSYNGLCYSAETLLRWNHPTKGLTFPDYFIEYLEESPFMIDVGEMVIRKSCEIIVKLKDEGYVFEKVSINISGQQFKDKLFFEKVITILRETNCNPSWVEFEITERILMENESIYKTLNDLRNLGISIALDDFGTGYSSLSVIDKLPIDKLKIDKSFIDTMTEENSIVDFIINLSQSLNLNVIAEGVESENQVNILKGKGCFDIQGYYYSKPLILPLLKEFLSNNTLQLEAKNKFFNTDLHVYDKQRLVSK